jgi:uncharacterized protein
LIWFLSVIFLLYGLICLFFYLSQESFIFFPEKLDKTYQFRFSGKFDELFIPANDGATINALHFKTENPRGVILFIHGNAGSLSTWGLEGEYFTQMGYDCLVYDFRNFGKSTGKNSEQTLYRDAHLMYEYLNQKYPEKKIIIAGRSLGTGIASRLAAETDPGKLILITPYYSVKKMGESMFGFLPVNLLLKFRLDNGKWIKKVKCPVYVIHGTKDEVIPFSHSLLLKKDFKSADSLFTINGGHHNDLSSFDEYNEVMKQIL